MPVTSCLAFSVRLAAVMGVPVALCMVMFGFFAEPAKDPNRARYTIGVVKMARLVEAIKRYKLDCGDYPSTSEGLRALIDYQGIKGWQGPYVNEVPLDPWHRPYVYLRSPGSAEPEIRSYGSDGLPGGDFFNRDLSSRNLKPTIPDTPSEVRSNHVLIEAWIGAWVLLVASLHALCKP